MNFFRRRMLLCILKCYGVRRLYLVTVAIFFVSMVIFGYITYNQQHGHKNTDMMGLEVKKEHARPKPVVNKPNFRQNLTSIVVAEKVQNSTIFLPNPIPKEQYQDNTLYNIERLIRTTKPNYNIHTFYYPWYGNPKSDKVYLHWNHDFVQHWNPLYAKQWPAGQHAPPDDLGANFYPYLGPYSSRDRKTVESHMRQIRAAGIGVVVVSWLPPDRNDGKGESWSHLIPQLLDTAHKYLLKVTFHIEPYKHRSIFSIKHSLKYIFKNYGNHPAFYKHTYNQKKLPMFYIYDSYEIILDRWQYLLRPGERYSIRGTELDAFFIGLVVKASHRREILESGFDGFYTYFASTGFSYGSNPFNWESLVAFAKQKKLIFIPSVGPGYDDTRIRPWNFQNRKSRENGTYYRKTFYSALKAKASVISITSFNEWHEGTQIELAKPFDIRNTYDDVIYSYEDYEPHPPEFYIMLTNHLVQEFTAWQLRKTT